MKKAKVVGFTVMGLALVMSVLVYAGGVAWLGPTTYTVNAGQTAVNCPNPGGGAVSIAPGTSYNLPSTTGCASGSTFTITTNVNAINYLIPAILFIVGAAIYKAKELGF
ncbi:MAG: hypothetical protein KGI38_11890 [Thaumarchaeota archaeon]|nr:hypothetical protein [Nitrososphaerota archaeon]